MYRILFFFILLGPITQCYGINLLHNFYCLTVKIIPNQKMFGLISITVFLSFYHFRYERFAMQRVKTLLDEESVDREITEAVTTKVCFYNLEVSYII